MIQENLTNDPIIPYYCFETESMLGKFSYIFGEEVKYQLLYTSKPSLNNIFAGMYFATASDTLILKGSPI